MVSVITILCCIILIGFIAAILYLCLQEVEAVEKKLHGIEMKLSILEGNKKEEL